METNNIPNNKLEEEKSSKDYYDENPASRKKKNEYQAKYNKKPREKKRIAQLNKYNREKGTYGNGDGKDASHKGGKIVGFEDESTNRARNGKGSTHRKKKKNEIKENNMNNVSFSPMRSLGVPREDMPQIKSTDVVDFIEFLKKNGVSSRGTTVRVGSVKMTQKEVNPDKVLSMMSKDNSSLGKPVIISSDGYILDGHHRVAALFNKDKNLPLKAIKVSIPIRTLLSKSKEYPKVSYKSMSEHKITETLTKENKMSAYKDFFKKKMIEFGVDSIKKMSAEEKKQFFNKVDAEWKSKNENKTYKKK